MNPNTGLKQKLPFPIASIEDSAELLRPSRAEVINDDP